MRSVPWIALPLAVAGCLASEPTEPPSQAVVCAWDVSTSMRPGFSEAGREVCVSAVQAMEQGWISVRIIGAGGYASEAEIARFDYTSPTGCTNPFSALCRAKRARAKAEIEMRRKEAIEQIQSYRPGRAVTGATDLEGVLAAIDDVLRAVPADSTWRKTAILATDLVQSGGSEPVKLNLADVDLEVWVQWPGDAAEGRRLREEFESRMRDAGARSITYHSLSPKDR